MTQLHSENNLFQVHITQAGNLYLSTSEQHTTELHALWMRERVMDLASLDTINHQRLYEYAEFPLDLQIQKAHITENNRLHIQFSDGHDSHICLHKISQELGWTPDPESPPQRQIWDGTFRDFPHADWADMDTPSALIKLLDGFFRFGFCLIDKTPTHNQLETIAGKFGYVRDQNFGKIFHVETKPVASDQAYTHLELLAHTDNPYRQPIPGIQYLQCIKNEATGGNSTLVDGLALVAALEEEMPESLAILEHTPIRFVYDGPAGILVNYGPLIERDCNHQVTRLRLSSRLDYVPALPCNELDRFYKARRRLHKLSNDPAFQISFPFSPGVLLIMDNYTVLHGRTAFNAASGPRYLQGCYIDHDGPNSLYRQIKRDGQTTSVIRES